MSVPLCSFKPIFNQISQRKCEMVFSKIAAIITVCDWNEKLQKMQFVGNKTFWQDISNIFGKNRTFNVSLTLKFAVRYVTLYSIWWHCIQGDCEKLIKIEHSMILRYNVKVCVLVLYRRFDTSPYFTYFIYGSRKIVFVYTKTCTFSYLSIASHRRIRKKICLQRKLFGKVWLF